MVRCIDCMKHTLVCFTGTSSNVVICTHEDCVVDPLAPKECAHFEGRKPKPKKPTANVFDPKRHYKSSKR